MPKHRSFDAPWQLICYSEDVSGERTARGIRSGALTTQVVRQWRLAQRLIEEDN